MVLNPGDLDSNSSSAMQFTVWLGARHLHLAGSQVHCNGKTRYPQNYFAVSNLAEEWGMNRMEREIYLTRPLLGSQHVCGRAMSLHSPSAAVLPLGVAWPHLPTLGNTPLRSSLSAREGRELKSAWDFRSQHLPHSPPAAATSLHLWI